MDNNIRKRTLSSELESSNKNTSSYDNTSFQLSSNEISNMTSHNEDDLQQLITSSKSVGNKLTSQHNVSINSDVSLNKEPEERKRNRSSTLIQSIIASVRKLKKSLGALQGFALMVGILFFL